MRLVSPFPLETLGQKFGANAVSYATVSETIGHPGDDFTQAWGTPIPNVIEGAVVSSVLSKDNPDLMAFRAINTLYEDSSGCYEIQYGHCSDIFVKVGDVLKLGQIVANIGNTGTVFGGSPLKEITLLEKQSGSHAGSHLHFQVRLLKKIPTTSVTGANKCLNDGHGLLSINGFSYDIVNYDNGFHGCVDPQWFIGPPIGDVIKEEVKVLSSQRDPSVRQKLIDIIVMQVRKLLGF